jgi:hypothetical protein
MKALCDLFLQNGHSDPNKAHAAWPVTTKPRQACSSEENEQIRKKFGTSSFWEALIPILISSQKHPCPG